MLYQNVPLLVLFPLLLKSMIKKKKKINYKIYLLTKSIFYNSENKKRLIYKKSHE